MPSRGSSLPLTPVWYPWHLLTAAIRLLSGKAPIYAQSTPFPGSLLMGNAVFLEQAEAVLTEMICNYLRRDPQKVTLMIYLVSYSGWASEPILATDI